MPRQRGDVLLIPFPFTDLSGRKARPVVVLSGPFYENRTGDVIVAMLTSAPRAGPFDCPIQRWREAGLLLPTWARAKVATLTSRLVLHRLGRLGRDDLLRVNAIVRRALGCAPEGASGRGR